jgi:hypothetical protein
MCENLRAPLSIASGQAFIPEAINTFYTEATSDDELAQLAAYCNALVGVDIVPEFSPIIELLIHGQTAFTPEEQQELSTAVARLVSPPEDVLDWDITIDEPPSRSAGVVRARVAYGGRSKPIPVENPWAA